MENKVAPKRRKNNSRDKILDATLALMQELGPNAVTLDLVAQRAGVSKGGLLHHFPYKDDLFLAANEHLVLRRRASRDREMEKLPPGPSQLIKAYVMASVKNSDGNDQINTRLMGAGSGVSQETREPIRRDFKERFPPFAQDVGLERAALIYAATEGLWFMDITGMSPFTDKQRSTLIKAILAIADGGDFAPPMPGTQAAGPKKVIRKSVL